MVLIILFLMALAPLKGEERFLSNEDVQKFIRFNGNAPLPRCETGQSVPIEATFSATDGRLLKVRPWKGTRQGWLKTAASQPIVNQAIAYFKGATSLLKGNNKSITVRVHLPCEQTTQ